MRWCSYVLKWHFHERLVKSLYGSKVRRCPERSFRLSLSYPPYLHTHMCRRRTKSNIFFISLSINTQTPIDIPPHRFHITKLASHSRFHQTAFYTFQRASILSDTQREKLAIMTSHKHLLSFLIVMISFVACYSTLQEDPLSLYVEDSPYIDDGGTFMGLIKPRTDVLSLKMLDKLGGGTTPSLKTFNVNDYGAQGDGRTDDTQVCTHLARIIVTLRNS